MWFLENLTRQMFRASFTHKNYFKQFFNLFFSEFKNLST